ncbi:hypothetical protein ACTQ46_08640 [Gallicola sp. Sow4_E12]|uniref:hypothetical protein n=1 Tax=Gallicola sp. Sow4_E12 TaxID=3438785 RepID=UPI003F908965
MNPMLQKQVDSEFMTQEQAEVIQKAVDAKDSVIASGHRSAAVRPLLATLMAMTKGFNTKKIKELEDITDDADYLLLPGLAVENFEEYVQKSVEAKPSLVTIKEPEHPYSMLKIMKKALKATGNKDKNVWLLECRKIDNVPHLVEIQRVHYDEKGKVALDKLEF